MPANGDRVWNLTTGESGVILNGLQSGRVRVEVDVNPDDWKASVIGPPSRITAVWERWNISIHQPEPRRQRSRLSITWFRSVATLDNAVLQPPTETRYGNPDTSD